MASTWRRSDLSGAPPLTTPARTRPPCRCRASARRAEPLISACSTAAGLSAGGGPGREWASTGLGCRGAREGSDGALLTWHVDRVEPEKCLVDGPLCRSPRAHTGPPLTRPRREVSPRGGGVDARRAAARARGPRLGACAVTVLSTAVGRAVEREEQCCVHLPRRRARLRRGRERGRGGLCGQS